MSQTSSPPLEPASQTSSSTCVSLPTTNEIAERDYQLRCHPTFVEKGDTLACEPTATGATGVTVGLNRTATRRERVLSTIRSRPAVPVFSHALVQQKTKFDVLVDFDGPNDPYKPLNWPMHKKATTTFLYAMITMSATWASSSYSAGVGQIMQQFHVGTEVAVLGVSLYLIGFGTGPLLWAPLSEVFGRRLAVLIPMVPAICFTFGSATAENYQTLMLTRFFAGFFGSAPVTNTGGVLGDLFSPAHRGIAMVGFTMSVMFGPILGPIVSAAVVIQPNLGWRWTEYLTGILQIVILIFGIIFIDESYAPVLLVYKARRLRIESGNWALHAKFEEWDISIKQLASKFLIRPLQLLMTPICFLMALYASFVYGILYMQLAAIPIIFHEIRQWPLVVSELPFLGVLVGAIIGASMNIYNQFLYNKVYHRCGDHAVPEERLIPMMIGSVVFAAGQFIIGWTAAPHIPWIAPVIGLAMVGFGFFTIFQAAVNYLVDTFTLYAASAVAVNTFLRSCFATAFPLIIGPMVINIGIGPSLSIMGGFGAILIPVPFLFYRFGRSIRARNKWSRPSVYDLDVQRGKGVELA